MCVVKQECVGPNTWPLRDATRSYLTRPVESDFTLGGAVGYIFACVIYLFNIYTQAEQISFICSTGSFA
jgi:hypothetical protein